LILTKLIAPKTSSKQALAPVCCPQSAIKINANTPPFGLTGLSGQPCFGVRLHCHLVFHQFLVLMVGFGAERMAQQADTGHPPMFLHRQVSALWSQSAVMNEGSEAVVQAKTKMHP